jgi:uncharacterized membrane-anchored protein
MTKANRFADSLYWISILSACTMGETAGDYLSFGLELGYGWASIILSTLLILALVVDAFANDQTEGRYWATIVIMSTTGTAFADYITRTMQLGYGWGSVLLITLFAIIFFIEKLIKGRKETAPKANIHHTRLPRTDAFYWASIIVASTFGTTMGDFVSDELGLGFGIAALVLASILIMVLFAEFRSKKERKLIYWAALVVASTIGATTGDYLTKPDSLNLGYGWGSLILISIFTLIFLVRYRLRETLHTSL